MDRRRRRGRRRGGVAVVAQAGLALGRSSLAGRRDVRAPLYLAAGFAAVVLAGALVVLVLVAAGLLELAWRRRGRAAAARLAGRPRPGRDAHGPGLDRVQGRRAVVRRRLRDHPADAGGRGRPARLDDRGRVLNAVAFGQLTPGPVTHTVALVGWAASGLGGALLASAIAFAPSFLAVGLGGARFGGCAATGGERVPRRRRPGRRRRDPRGRRAAGRRARGGVAGRGARRGRGWLLVLGRAPLWALAGGALAGLVRWRGRRRCRDLAVRRWPISRPRRPTSSRG